MRLASQPYLDGDRVAKLDALVAARYGATKADVIRRAWTKRTLSRKKAPYRSRLRYDVPMSSALLAQQV